MRVHPQNRGNGRSLTPDSTRHRSAHLPGSRNSRALAGAVTPATGHGQRRQSRMVSPRTEPGSSRRTSLSAKSHSPPQPFRPADTGSRGSSLVPGATAAPGPRLRVHAQVPLERFLQTPFAVAARRRDLRCRQLPPHTATRYIPAPEPPPASAHQDRSPPLQARPTTSTCTDRETQPTNHGHESRKPPPRTAAAACTVCSRR